MRYERNLVSYLILSSTIALFEMGTETILKPIHRTKKVEGIEAVASLMGTLQVIT